jgi:hypothetical protein
VLVAGNPRFTGLINHPDDVPERICFGECVRAAAGRLGLVGLLEVRIQVVSAHSDRAASANRPQPPGGDVAAHSDRMNLANPSDLFDRQ